MHGVPIYSCLSSDVDLREDSIGDRWKLRPWLFYLPCLGKEERSCHPDSKRCPERPGVSLPL